MSNGKFKQTVLEVRAILQEYICVVQVDGLDTMQQHRETYVPKVQSLVQDKDKLTEIQRDKLLGMFSNSGLVRLALEL